jgi:putative ABC transport system ATP-binding protein
MNEILIECRNLTKVYESEMIKTTALSGASFTIERGEFVALMGPSGSGKSTLMHLLGLLDQATAGEYLFLGKNVTTLSQDELAEIRNQKIGFIFQSFNLLPRTTVFENVELPLLYDVYGSSRRAFRDAGKKVSLETIKQSLLKMWTSMGKETHEQKVDEALASVGMNHRRDYLTNQLSGGEMQRVAIARALVNNPDIIFADEPTGNLDSKSGLKVMEILQTLNDAGHTVVLVTHETSTAQHAKRMFYLKDGKIIADDMIKIRRIARDEKELAK